MPGSWLSRNPDIAGHPHPALTAQTGNLGTKRRQPKVRAGDGSGDGRGDTPSPRLKPLSQLTRRGAPRGGGAKEPDVRREEERGRGGERDRGRSGDRREGRREGEEDGKREPRRRDGDRDQGTGRGETAALSEDNGEREGGAGRSRARGRSLAPSDPAWDSAPGLLSSRRQPWPSDVCPQGFSPGSRITQVSRPPPPARQPRAVARDSGPSRDLGRKRQLLRAGPALPISCRSSPRICLPGPAFVTVGAGAAAGLRGTRREGAAAGAALGSQRFWKLAPLPEPLPHSSASTYLPRVPRSAARKLGDLEEGRPGAPGRGVGRSAGSGRHPAVIRGRGRCPDSSLARLSFPEAALQLERH